MRLSGEGLQFIASWEGCVLHLYNDPAGYCTIGYGHLVHKGKTGTRPDLEAKFRGGLTQESALELLREDTKRFENAVTSAVAPVILTQNQFDACVCLAFNIGPGDEKTGKGFAGSSLVKAIKKGLASPSEVRRCFGLFNKAGGKVDKGLVNRRASEATMFNRDS